MQDDLIDAIKEYILEALGFQMNSVPWGDRGLPIFVKDSYALYSISIMGKSYLLAVAKTPERTTPAQIVKHLGLIEEISGMPCIYAAQKLPAYNRVRLISHRVRFVIPGVQMYLPDLGIECRKISSFKRMSNFQGLIASAQTVVIYALIQNLSDCITPSELASELHYARMTMTRALDELEKRKLGKTIRKGKERCFSFFQNKKSLWEQALEYMQSPVKELIWVQIDNETFKKIESLGCIAGLTALEQQSMLAAPPLPVSAISQEVWKVLLQSENVRVLPIPEGANIQLEVWSYDPSLFAKNRVVDPFSLYLSLRENEDERIEQALRELMEKVKW